MSVQSDKFKRYVKSLIELAGVGFGAGAGTYVTAHGFELSKAGLTGLAVAGLAAAYGVVVKKLGDDSRASAVK